MLLARVMVGVRSASTRSCVVKRRELFSSSSRWPVCDDRLVRPLPVNVGSYTQPRKLPGLLWVLGEAVWKLPLTTLY
ncbi:hypothetical protein D3C84_587240 [compost metagenome]